MLERLETSEQVTLVFGIMVLQWRLEYNVRHEYGCLHGFGVDPKRDAVRRLCPLAKACYTAVEGLLPTHSGSSRHK